MLGMRERVSVHRAPLIVDELGNEKPDWPNQSYVYATVYGSLQTGRDALRNTSGGIRLTSETVLYLTAYEHEPTDRYTVAGRAYDVIELADQRYNGQTHHLRAVVVPLAAITDAESGSG